MTRKKRSILQLLVLLAMLPLLVIAARTVQQLVGRALGRPAHIVVDTQKELDTIAPFWQSLAQGGEESSNMIAPVVDTIQALHPRSIRIDHIYDAYDVVGRNESGLVFDFSQLDAVIDSIQQTGAVPFISLSYMPPAIARNGNVTNEPNHWDEWAQVVQRTIQHYSGTSEKNIANIYYEVWNEPDLFGDWKVYGDKNYITLYSYAAAGAARVANANSFYLGGPATTKLYKNWIDALLKYAQDTNTRLDFISWHQYDTDPKSFLNDSKQVTKWSFQYPSFINIPKLITEWGFDPDINAGYDSEFAAAHMVASVRQVLFGYEHMMLFEIVDGPDPSGNEYWGRWGLITHPDRGKHTKPRFAALKLLNTMHGNQLVVSGEGSWVTGFATKDADAIRLILANYDQDGTHVETVPITFTNLPHGEYAVTQTVLPGVTATIPHTVTDGTLELSIFMPQSAVALLELRAQ